MFKCAEYLQKNNPRLGGREQLVETYFSFLTFIKFSFLIAQNIFLVGRIVETACHALIYLIFSVANINRYSAFSSLKNEGHKKANPVKPR